MKEGFIKIEGYDNLYYDSVERKYRVKMTCFLCGKLSGCRCFYSLDEAEMFIIDGMYYTCSARCSFNGIVSEYGLDYIKDVMVGLGIIWRLRYYIFRFTGYISEDSVTAIFDSCIAEFDDIDGTSC